jgi:AraC-like DNA-binding protein
VIFLLKGTLKYELCSDERKIMNAGHMLFMPYKSTCDLEFSEGSTAVELKFEKSNFTCITVPSQTLRPLIDDAKSDSNVLPINKSMHAFLDLLVLYLRNGVSCTSFHIIKIDEFFIVLRHFYSKEHVAGFLAPLLGSSQEFRISCLRTRATCHNITEMVNQSGMSKTKFYEEFRKEFGDINPKKWFDNYLEYKILHAVSRPGMNVKKLAYELDFESDAAFSQYCHRHFGVTASELIKQRRKGLENW